MDLKDIAYRAGLVMASFLLASIFAMHLGLFTSGAEEEEAREVALALRDSLNALLSSSEGSSLVVSFGAGLNNPGAALECPERLGKEGYSIRVHPGLITIDWTGGRETVLEDRSIVPSHPPTSGRPMNRSELDGLYKAVVPFELKTPCRLFATVPIGASGGLFLSPVGDIDADVSFGMAVMSELVLADPMPYPGYRSRAEVTAPSGACITGPLLILLGSGGSDMVGPECSVPFLLPLATSIELEGRAVLPPGSRLVLTREAVTCPDGNLTVLSRLMAPPLPR